MKYDLTENRYVHILFQDNWNWLYCKMFILELIKIIIKIGMLLKLKLKCY